MSSPSRIRLPLVIACICATLASGCASATLDVLSPVPIALDTVSIVVLDDTGGDLSPDQMRGFKRNITHQLLDAGIEVLPADTKKRGVVRVVGNVVRYDPGIRALRFVSRYGLGTGGLESMWNVVDSRSDSLASCRIEGSVSTGTFGGSFDDVEKETGKALARFLRGDVQ